jgi:hypothetical protein
MRTGGSGSIVSEQMLCLWQGDSQGNQEEERPPLEAGIIEQARDSRLGSSVRV